MESDNKTKEYQERHTRWQNYAITQLGYTNNVILLLATGLLGFIFDKDAVKNIFDIFQFGVNCNSILYSLSLASLFLSIMFGLLVTISRLYDFRINRNIVLTRKRFYEKKKDKIYSLPQSCNKTGLNKKKSFFVLIKLIFTSELPLISYEEVDEFKEFCPLHSKFSYLLETAEILGNLTWNYLKWQIFFFILSPVFYFLSFS
jgi:hypothetical protein